jgi:hypothetical protein
MIPEARAFLMEEIERERFRNNYDARSFDNINLQTA